MKIMDLILIHFANPNLSMTSVIDVWKLATKCKALVCAIKLRYWLYFETYLGHINPMRFLTPFAVPMLVCHIFMAFHDVLFI